MPDFTNLDPQVVTLAKAIRQAESGGNFNAVGDQGTSKGAYQFHNDHFEKWANHYGLDPKDFSPVNQDKVAYAKMKEWKDQGYHAGEIAAMWNGSRLENGRPVAINPDYITKIQKALGTPAQASQTPNNFVNPNETQSATHNFVTPPEISAPTPVPPSPASIPAPQPKRAPGMGLLHSIGQGLNDAAQVPIGMAKGAAHTATGLTGLIYSALDQTAGRVGNAISGKGFTTEDKSKTSEVFKKTADKLAPKGLLQKIGYGGEQIAEFFIPGGGEKTAVQAASKVGKALSLGSKATKAVELGSRGIISGLQNATLAKGQGQSNTEAGIVGGISAVSPFAGELLGKAMPVVKDFFGGEGTANALKIKKATPELVNAWQKGTRTINDLADTITQTAKNYETQGRSSFNAMKQALPDIAMPKNFVEGGIKKSLQDMVGAAPNLNAAEERTLANLQKYIDKAEVDGVKGIMDLRQGVDEAGFFRYGDAEYKNSNRIVQKFRDALNEAAQYQASIFDKANGTNHAEAIKNGLAEATDRIKFLQKFKANFIGTNPETYVERTVNKLKPLLNKFADETEKVSTKTLLAEFEKRIGKPGMFAKDFQAANAAKNLVGVGGRIAKNVLTKVGIPTALLEGGGLLHKAFFSKSSPSQ